MGNGHVGDQPHPGRGRRPRRPSATPPCPPHRSRAQGAGAGRTPTHGVSGHTAGTYWLEQPDTPAGDVRVILNAHHADIGERPCCAASSSRPSAPPGPRLSGTYRRTPDAARWYEFAGKRTPTWATYRITDEKPIPKQYAESAARAYLAQITDVHKRGALSRQALAGSDPGGGHRGRGDQ
ncbi:hypothetical protein QJS66_23695 (plasmid) [Kocuria rhizophila]|nr:hypothetical protein QJS66_23695 [Kocuria rhizophila]